MWDDEDGREVKPAEAVADNISGVYMEQWRHQQWRYKKSETVA